MTEQEWQGRTDPSPLLTFLRKQSSPSYDRLLPSRKHRLFACACCRRISHFLTEMDLQLVQRSEQYANGEMDYTGFLESLAELFGLPAPPTPNELRHRDGFLMFLHRRGVSHPFNAAVYSAADLMPENAATMSRHTCLTEWNRQRRDKRSVSTMMEAEGRMQASLIRDIFGNPFRRVTVDPSWLAWNDGTVVKMAQAIYDERAFDHLPVLADALEEAGCHVPDLVAHCRAPSEHARGCWVLDLLLGKE